MFNHSTTFRIQTTMDSLRRQVEWLILLLLSTVIIAVTTSAVVDNATVSLFETNFRVDDALALNAKQTENQYSSGKFQNLETTTTNVFNDFCRFHGNLLDSSFTSSHSQMDKNGNNIDVLHEIFDSSFGLVPYVSYRSKTYYSIY
jgi:hypothetical protein